MTKICPPQRSKTQTGPYAQHHQSRACGQPSSGIPSYAGRVELTSHVATCSDRCTEWLHVVLSAPCSTEAKHGSVDVTEQAWTAVGRLRDGLTDAGWYDHPQALADACTASTCPISSRLPWADDSHAYGPRQVQETISVRQRGGGVGSSEASVLREVSWLTGKYSIFLAAAYRLILP